MGRNAQHLFHRALAYQQLVTGGILDHDRQATTDKVERQFIDLAVGKRHLELGVLFRELHHRLVHQVFHAALVKAVEPGQGQHGVIALAKGIDVMLEDDLVLGEGAGLVGAQHIHRAEVLDRIEALDHHFALGHGRSTLGQVGADDHRQHFRGKADGYRQGKQEGIAPIALGEAIEEKHDGYHHQHEADQQPADTVHAPVEGGLHPRADNRLGQGAKVSARPCCHHHCFSAAADHVGAHEADVRQVQQVALVGGQGRGGLLRDIAQGVVLLHRQGFAGQHGLADKQVAGLDQADIGGDHVAG